MNSGERVIAAINHRQPDRCTIGPGGGFMFSTNHNIAVKEPPEHLIRLYETARGSAEFPPRDGHR